jgi:hypothetical protein
MRRENAWVCECVFGVDRRDARMGVGTADDGHEKDCGASLRRTEVVNILAASRDEPLVFATPLASRWDVTPGHGSRAPFKIALTFNAE